MSSQAPDSDESSRRSGRWLDGDDHPDAGLPESLEPVLTRFPAVEALPTLDGVPEARSVGGGRLDGEGPRHAGRATPHRAELDGGAYHVRRFSGAVALVE